MAVKIRLKRMGRTHRSFFRVGAMDVRSPRNGRMIEELGWYDPNSKSVQVKLDMERVNYWLGVGAQTSETVANLIKNYKEPAEQPQAKPEPVKAPEPKAEEPKEEPKAEQAPQAEEKAEEPKAEETAESKSESSEETKAE
ncbi:MAG: 30S ribosomal protein S16 [Phycisphaerae bacterium]